MKNPFLTLPVIILLSCSSPKQGDTLSADSIATKPDSLMPASLVVAETPAITNLSTPVDSLTSADSLFNFLARRKIVRGEFGDVIVLTDKLIDPDNLDAAQNMLAVLVHSGEGQG